MKKLFVIFSVLDAVLTAACLKYSSDFEEINTFMAYVIDEFGFAGFFMVKAIGVAFVVWSMSRCEILWPTVAKWIWVYACVITGIAALSGVIANAHVYGRFFGK